MNIHEARRCIRYCVNYLRLIDESPRAARDLIEAVNVIVKYKISKISKKKRKKKNDK